MSWIALELEVEGAVAGPLSDALLELGADSVTIEEAHARTATAPFDEADAPRWERNRICAIVSPQTDARALVRNAAHAAGLPSAPFFDTHRLEAEDWVRRTQSQFGPLPIGDRLWIVPSWAEPPSDPQAVVLRLDPGLAFGTGSHPTTRLVLTWLERELAHSPPAGCRVLDYGCGSGILALTAAKLGCGLEVVATDNDPQALATCTENAAQNHLPVVVLPPEQLGTRGFDLIVANILARPLVELAPTLSAHATEGGRIALSGVLQEQANEVIAAYAPYFELALAGQSEGWALIAGVRQ